MPHTLIDTLRFADRLKEAGFIGPQAEALARTLGDELTEQLPSKADFKTLEAKVDALDTSLNGRLDAREPRPDGRIDSLQGDLGVRFESLGAKIDGLGYRLTALLVLNGLFLALVSVILALGLAEPVSKLFGS